MKSIYFLTTYLTFSSIMVTAQDMPTHHLDSTGNLYWRKSAPVYLFVSDSPEGEKQRIKSKSTEKYADPFYLDTEGVNYIRTRNAVDPETMQIIPDTEVMFEIYADGLPPVTKNAFQYESSFKESIQYFQEVSVTLSAKDELSGVSSLQYSINEQEYRDYDSALQFVEDGTYSIQYFATDMVGNKEEVKELQFIVDATASYSNLSINGITDKKVISTGSKMYITAEDSLSGVAQVYFKFDEGDYQKYNGSSIPFNTLSEGDHTITYYSIDRVKNKEKEKSMSFYLDKTAPLMVADVLGDRFIVGDEIYFSGRTKLKLTAVDNKVGVKEIKYSIDDNEFVEYKNPFYLPSIAGIHSIRYYSVDNLNNSTTDSKKSRYLGQGGYEEFKHNVNKFYVDLTGPLIDHAILNHSFIRDDTLFIGPHTKIRFSGRDSESGLNRFAYSFNEEVGEKVYEEPFTISEGKDGFYTLQYFGYDNVNNRNVSEFPFYYDGTLPEVFTQFNTGSVEGSKIPTYPITSGLFLSATDLKSGIKSLTYNLDGSAFVPYRGLITGFKKGKHEMTIRAVDYLNNVREETIEFKIK